MYIFWFLNFRRINSLTYSYIAFSSAWKMTHRSSMLAVTFSRDLMLYTPLPTLSFAFEPLVLCATLQRFLSPYWWAPKIFNSALLIARHSPPLLLPTHIRGIYLCTSLDSVRLRGLASSLPYYDYFVKGILVVSHQILQ